MISYETYKVIHLLGIMFLLFSLGAYTILSTSGSQRGRRLAAVTHGIAVVIILVAGFGLLARLDVGFQLWVWVKLIIWLILAVIIILIKRMPNLMPLLWFLIPVLAALAAYMAVFKEGA